MVDAMPRYDTYLNVRIDPIVSRALERLASKWGVKQKAKRGYKSETTRLAIVFAYLVDVLHVDPREAPDKAIEYLSREI